ncbi:MAG: HAD-IIB family hydrolase [Chthoniobacterales bacterium]
MNLPVHLLSTDFDGTLIGHPSDGRCISEFGEILKSHKAAGGKWVINTGRSFIHTLEGMEHFQAPLEPDFLIALEREIYCRDEQGGWQEHMDWNNTCREQHQILFKEVKPLIDALCAYISDSTDVTLISEGLQPVGLVTTSEEVMHRVVEVIERHGREYPNFAYQRNTIYLRFCHSAYHKGSALSEIGRMLNISAQNILAAGDNYNDLGMLDGKHAAMTACPENAIPEVKQMVKDSAGYIASAKYAEGIAEAYRWFVSGKKTSPLMAGEA